MRTSPRLYCYIMSISSSIFLASSRASFFHYNKVFIPNPGISSAICASRRLLFHRSITIEQTSSKIFAASSSPASMSLQSIEELPPKLQEITRLFQGVDEPKTKYEQLMFYGRNLSPLDAKFKTLENKVQGCVSQVWVRAYLDANKGVIYEADSDSVLTKGLAALLVQGLSGRSIEEILGVSPDFVALLGLQQSLTPSRNNGFLNMLKLMQMKALQLRSVTESSIVLDDAASNQENIVADTNVELKGSTDDLGLKMELDTEASSLKFEDQLGSRGRRIRDILQKKLNPVELVVEDISHQHSGHVGVKGLGGETHFNVKIVSSEFEGKSLVKRHRIVYLLLNDELKSGLHALSIVARTPSEIDGQ